MKPRLRHRLVNSLFSNFIKDFFYLFNDNDFEGGCEFKVDILTNIYSKLYLPGNEIVGVGEPFSEMLMIQDGVVSVSLQLGESKYS